MEFYGYQALSCYVYGIFRFSVFQNRDLGHSKNLTTYIIRCFRKTREKHSSIFFTVKWKIYQLSMECKYILDHQVVEGLAAVDKWTCREEEKQDATGIDGKVYCFYPILAGSLGGVSQILVL